MIRDVPRPLLRRTATSSILLAALAMGCSSPAGRHASAPSARPSDGPGDVRVDTGDIDLAVTHATVRLDPSGSGVLTMTLHNGGDAPEHLAMVAAPGGGRGTLTGVAGNGDGSLSSAGVLVRSGGTVTFGSGGPQIRFTGVHATGGTMPLSLEFGIAGLVHVNAVVRSA